MPTTNIVTATIAEIRLLTTATKLSDTYYSTDAGKEGIWNRTNQTGIFNPDDNTGTVLVDASGYKWRRLIHNGEYMPEWFYDEGPSYTDALKDCLKAAENNTVILSEGKIYEVGSRIEIDNSVRLAGTGTLKKIAPAKNAVIHINEGIKGVIIENITIDGNRDAFSAIEIITTLRGIEASSVKTSASSNIPSRIIENIQIKNIQIKNTYNEAILTDCCNDIYITNCYIENCGQSNLKKDAECKEVEGAAIEIRANALTYKTSSPVEFHDVVIADCYIDQTANYSGCIKVSATGNQISTTVAFANILRRVKIVNNTCLMRELDVTSELQDHVAILGIECLTRSNGAILDLLINGNVLNTIPNPNEASRPNVLGISLGGVRTGSKSPNFPNNNILLPVSGISGVIISNNIIRSCRIYGIEVVGDYVTVISNQLYDCGRISLHSNSIIGGMHDAKVIGNTINGNAGYNACTIYEQQSTSISIQCDGYSMYGTLIEGNIFEGITGDRNNVDMVYIVTGDATGTSPGNGQLIDFSIINNQFRNIRQNGITFNGTVYAKNVNISGNTFKYDESLPTPSTLFYALLISGSPQIKKLSVTNNIFDCFVSTGNRNGIRVSNNSSTHSDFIFSENIFNNVNYGILIASKIQGLLITNNIFDTASTKSLAIPDPYKCTNFIEKQNIFRGSNSNPLIYKEVVYLNPIVKPVDPVSSPYANIGDLNNVYPGVAPGQLIVCTALSTPLIYEKISDTQWISYEVTKVL